MLKEILLFGLGYLVGRSEKTRRPPLIILACAAYTVFAICTGVMFLLGLVLVPVKLVLRLARASIRRFPYPK